jgi:aminoglycoside 3-N-acetyltransferase
MNQVNVTPDEITHAVRQLGVRPGDLLIVHGSLSSFGHVEGGAASVAGALVGSVSPGGSVFVPTFTYARVPFDPAASPSFDGAITEAVRQFPGAARSLHPTHSWAGVGFAAWDILAGHEHATPFGSGSPVWRLWERDAKVLLIGVDHRANSMIHVAEESLRLPYLERTRAAQVVRPDGTLEEVVVRRPGCSAGFGNVDVPLRAAGQMREARAGAARLTLMRARDVVSVAVEMLSRDAAALLCGRAECEVCGGARRVLAAGSGS